MRSFCERLCLLAVCLPLVAAAKDVEKGGSEPSPGARENGPAAQRHAKSIDEVTVMGARSPANLRLEVVQAEDNIYAIFNSLNDDDRYDVICKKETRIGSQIPYRVCQVRLFREAISEAAGEIALSSVDGGALLEPLPNAQKHMKILKQKMLALAEKHPELLVALNERYKLSKKFEQERAKRYD